MKPSKTLALIFAAALPLTGPQAPAQSAVETSSADQPHASAANLSASAAEVVRLAGSGVSEDVVLAYIQNSQSTFNLSVDDVLYLKDLGISSAIISAMLNRDNALRNQPQASVVTPQPATPAPATETSVEEVTAQNAPADVTYFYNDLSPYGSWVDLGGVGWCWQPRAAAINHSWRPYCDSGHWVDTDAGWFWQSDYTWGWAPFHYGRWLMHDRVGWVWMPDRIWGPSWVVWRSSGDECGWAPLPPHAVLDARAGWRYNGLTVSAGFDFGLRPEHFTFVAFHDFADRDLRRHRLPPDRARAAFAHATIINNYTVRNQTVINHGPPLQRVAAAAPTSIPHASIQTGPPGARPETRPQVRGQSQAVVYRPELRAPSKPVTVVAQKVDDRHPQIQQPVVQASPGPRSTPGMPSNPSTGSGMRSGRPTQTSTPTRQGQPSGGPQGNYNPRGTQSGSPSGSQPGYSPNQPNQGRPGQGQPGSGYPYSSGPSSSTPSTGRPGQQSTYGRSASPAGQLPQPATAPSSHGAEQMTQPQRSNPSYPSRNTGPGTSYEPRNQAPSAPSQQNPSYQPRNQNPSSPSRPDSGSQPGRSGGTQSPPGNQGNPRNDRP